MKVLAPIPESSVKTEILDGYQLCARCGQPLVMGEEALAAPRLNSWLVYTHQIGPDCPPKAVRGWKALRFADTARKSPIKDAYRPGQPYFIGKSLRACVSLLDDKHIEAELALVTCQPSDEISGSTADLGDALSRFQARDSVEDDLNAAIDANNLDKTLELLAECLNLERKKSYLTLRAAPAVDPNQRCFQGTNVVATTLGERRRKLQWGRADHVLTRDLKERPVEFPLYSNRKVFELEGKQICELECWARKPEPIKLRHNSVTHPQVFLWAAESLRQLEPVDSENPYGPVGMLMRHRVEHVNAQRNDASRCENIKWEEAE